jgi:hypothetical protein
MLSSFSHNIIIPYSEFIFVPNNPYELIAKVEKFSTARYRIGNLH